jgi:hypothetical protein
MIRPVTGKAVPAKDRTAKRLQTLRDGGGDKFPVYMPGETFGNLLYIMGELGTSNKTEAVCAAVDGFAAKLKAAEKRKAGQ